MTEPTPSKWRDETIVTKNHGEQLIEELDALWLDVNARVQQMKVRAQNYESQLKWRDEKIKSLEYYCTELTHQFWQCGHSVYGPAEPRQSQGHDIFGSSEPRQTQSPWQNPTAQDPPSALYQAQANIAMPGVFNIHGGHMRQLGFMDK
jgi:hypothetical protein